jgi:hypothetical protein
MTRASREGMPPVNGGTKIQSLKKRLAPTSGFMYLKRDDI